jgi:hypothetical protein
MRTGRHTVTLNLGFEDNGTKKTEQCRVIYRGLSILDGSEIDERLDKTNDKREALVEWLTAIVIELPDIIEDNGSPVTPDREFFSMLDTFYLYRINSAIQNDRVGN